MGFADPQKNTAQFQLMPGSHVADIGAGSGFYTFEAAAVVGVKGRVYAVDVQKDMLSKLKSEATRRRLSNIDVIWGDVEKLGGTKLKEASIDAAIISNTLFQLENKKGAVDEVKRILKPGGRVFVIDWSDSFGGLGPQPEHVFGRSKAQALFENAGYLYAGEFRTGDHHYGLVFKKV